MKNVQKRYIFLGMVIVLVGILAWRLSSSYASVNQGYTGKNIISGDKWGINITNVSDVEKAGKAEIINDVSTIGTTLNFSVVLFKPGDKVSFNSDVENTSILDAELYALTLTGLNDIDSENITYTILPIDDSVIHTNEENGSILRSGNNKEVHLSLGSTIIYKQK